MISNLLIDLDGTLTNPKSGIIRSVQFALKTLGLRIPQEDELIWLIGPPLRESFEILLNGSGLSCDEAVRIFRDRFGKIGIFENEIYDGVFELLVEQSATKRRLIIASTKPLVYINKILEFFEIAQFFDRVYGSELDGMRSNKSDLLSHIFAELKLNPHETIMIGDRIYDIEAAKALRINSIWVDYGYGDELERKIANPDYICGSIDDLRSLLDRI